MSTISDAQAKLNSILSAGLPAAKGQTADQKLQQTLQATSGPPATPVGPTSTVSIASTPSFAQWAMGFVVVSVVLLATQDSEQWAGVGSKFAWLLAGTMVVTKFGDIQNGFHQISTL